MSIIELTPRVYNKNMQWKISPKNIIDTVSLDPIINSISDSPQNIRTLTYNTVNSYSGNKTSTLPLSAKLADSGFPLHKLVYARNYRTDMEWGASHELAKARVDSVGGRITDSIVLETSIAGLPQATVSVSGKSYICKRSKMDYSAYPSWDNLKDASFDLGEWIYNNHTEEQNFLQASYVNGVPLMPFISSAGYSSGRLFLGTEDVSVLPVDSDFWCKFNTGTVSGYEQGASFNYWTMSYPYEAIKQVIPLGWKGTQAALGRLPSVNHYMNVLLKQGADRYHYDLSVDVPIRLAWMAASRYYGPFDGEHFLDSFAFLDLVTAINVEIAGKPYNTDDVVYNYSLDSKGNLIDASKNDNAYKIDKNELITAESTFNSQPWTSEMAKTFLNKYKNGKYIVTVQVPARWAILNNVHVNTPMIVKTLEGGYIARAGKNCVFEVKNIIKHFENSEFYYQLQLMEV